MYIKYIKKNINYKPKIVLYEPEIPNNVGAIIRTCHCLALELILIEPLGFIMQDRELKRAAMDYKPVITIIKSIGDFLNIYSNYRKILFTPHTSFSIETFQKSYMNTPNSYYGDLLIFGRESNGMEQDIVNYMDLLVSLPMTPDIRSFNLSVSVSMASTCLLV